LYDADVVTVEQPPPCPGGHLYEPGKVLVGWAPCDCQGTKLPAGHRTYWCTLCGRVLLVPPCSR